MDAPANRLLISEVGEVRATRHAIIKTGADDGVVSRRAEVPRLVITDDRIDRRMSSRSRERKRSALFRPTAVEADLSKSADVGALVQQAEQTKSLRRIEPVTNATLQDAPRYRWVALSNTTLGSFIASVSSNIIVIAL